MQQENVQGAISEQYRIADARMQLEKWMIERQAGMICQIEGETILVEGTIAEIRENAAQKSAYEIGW